MLSQLSDTEFEVDELPTIVRNLLIIILFVYYIFPDIAVMD